MGVFRSIVFFAALVAVTSYLFNFYISLDGAPPPLPQLDENQWWGPGNRPIDVGAKIRPFKIDFSKQAIDDLTQRLDRYLRIYPTTPLEDQGFQYGFNSDYLRTIITYWRNEYPWKEREAYLNQYPQFTTFMNGLETHFLRASPNDTQGKKVLPLLLLHGWPGSIREFYEIIPLLTTPREDSDFVFDIVAPSLPGYGFSRGASKAGLGTAQIAVLMNKLMRRLGFQQYYVQGGDWGAQISKQLATLYPKNVLGVHSNFCMVRNKLTILKWVLGSLYPTMWIHPNYTHKLYPIGKFVSFMVQETGYAHIQATKPDTIGTALKDSPAGLAAYILEKFSTWTNPEWKTLPDGGLTKKFTLDALLDNVMIYWLSSSITTSQRLYAENFNEVNQKLELIPVSVPTACARFKHELVWLPESFLKDKYSNLLQVTDFDDGGHFAAFEEPEKLSEDIWLAVKKFEAYHASRVPSER